MTESLKHNYIRSHENSLTGLNPTEIYLGIKGYYNGKCKYSIIWLSPKN